jgi:hypothetical protein
MADDGHSNAGRETPNRASRQADAHARTAHAGVIHLIGAER